MSGKKPTAQPGQPDAKAPASIPKKLVAEPDFKFFKY